MLQANQLSIQQQVLKTNQTTNQPTNHEIDKKCSKA